MLKVYSEERLKEIQWEKAKLEKEIMEKINAFCNNHKISNFSLSYYGVKMKFANEVGDLYICTDVKIDLEVTPFTDIFIKI